MIKPVKSSRPGTPPCVRAISGASGLTPAVAEVALEADLAAGADLAVEEAPEVVVDSVQPEVLSRLRVVADLARLPLLADLAHLPRLQREADLAEEEVSVEALHRSFSAAMVGN